MYFLKARASLWTPGHVHPPVGKGMAALGQPSPGPGQPATSSTQEDAAHRGRVTDQQARAGLQKRVQVT